MKSRVVCLRNDPVRRKFQVTNGTQTIKTLTWKRAMLHANCWATQRPR